MDGGAVAGGAPVMAERVGHSTRKLTPVQKSPLKDVATLKSVDNPFRVGGRLSGHGPRP
jgi:hypothetical protein